LNSADAELDRQSIAYASGMLLYFVVLKMNTAWWFIYIKSAHPDIPFWQIPLLIGGDIAVCLVFAIIITTIRSINLPGPRFIRFLQHSLFPFLLYSSVILFSLISWQVNVIYSFPLTIAHVRAAGHLADMRDSMLAYIKPWPLLLLVVGVMIYFAFAHIAYRIKDMDLPKSPRWRLWGSVLLTSFAIIIPWFIFCRGSIDYGLKRNAILHFIQYYEPAPKAVDLSRLYQKLSQELSGKDMDLRASRSIANRDLVLSSRFDDIHGKASGMNVLLILMESTSAQYLDKSITPNLFKLTETGVIFDNYFTTVTQTDRATYSILYSDYLPDLYESPRLLYKTRLTQPSIASMLKREGYHTACFFSGDLNYSDLNFIVDDFTTKVGANEITNNNWGWSWGALEESSVNAISQWVAVNKSGKFFLIYSTVFPHHPYFTPKSQTILPPSTLKNKYCNTLNYVDEQIGNLINNLKRSGAYDNTLIIITGDHGETVSSFPCGHGINLSTEEMKVPLILSNPTLFPNARRVDTQANHLDLGPSILGMLNLKSPADWLGRDLTGKVFPARLLHVRAPQSQAAAVIDGDLIYRCRKDDNRGTLASRP